MARHHPRTTTENFLFGVGDFTLNTLFFAPSQRIRLLMTVQRELSRKKLLDSPYNDPLDCAKKIVRREGFFGLWRGTMFDSNLLGLGQLAISHLLSAGVITIANTWTIGPSAGRMCTPSIFIAYV